MPKQRGQPGPPSRSGERRRSRRDRLFVQHYAEIAFRRRVASHAALLPYLCDFRRYVLEEIRRLNERSLPTHNLDAFRRLVRSVTRLKWRAAQALEEQQGKLLTVSEMTPEARRWHRAMNSALFDLNEGLQGLDATQRHALEVDVIAGLALEATTLEGMKRADVAIRFARDELKSAGGVERMFADMQRRAFRIFKWQDRAKGPRAAAKKRHADHVEENVEPYRKEYKDRLRAAKQKIPFDSYQKLSKPIVADIAERDGKREKWLRDTIKPRTVWKELKAEKN